MKNQKFVLDSVLRSWKTHFTVQLTSVIVLAGSFTVVFSLFLGFQNLHALMVSWGSEMEMNVYFADDLPAAEQGRIKNLIGSMDGIQTVRLADRNQTATAFFRKMSKYVPDVKNDAEFFNMIPSLLTIQLRPEFKSQGLAQLTNQILAIKGIEDVSYGQEWLRNFQAFAGALSKLTWGLMIVVLMGCFFVIGYSVKSIVVSRRDEIEILELIGADNRTIRMPFLIEGMFLGAFASLIGLLLTYFLLKSGQNLLNSEMSFWASNLKEIKFFSGLSCFALLIGGAGVGTVSAFASIQKASSGWAALHGKI